MAVLTCPTRDDAVPAVTEPVADNDVSARRDEPGRPDRGGRWRSILLYGLFPTLVLALAMAAGLLKFWDLAARASQTARVESVQAAKDATVAMLSYQPDTVEADLTAARDLLTGDFRDAYTELTNEVVIPGATEKRISTVASVPAAASVSATPGHAVVLVFVNQSAIVGSDAPTDTASSIRVTLEKTDNRWLVSAFDPI